MIAKVLARMGRAYRRLGDLQAARNSLVEALGQHNTVENRLALEQVAILLCNTIGLASVPHISYIIICAIIRTSNFSHGTCITVSRVRVILILL